MVIEFLKSSFDASVSETEEKINKVTGSLKRYFNYF